MSSFFEYVGQCMPQLTLGLKLTLQMTVFSLILAVVVGMVMCMFSISKVKPLNWISGIYLSLIRGTPLMVQAFFIYEECLYHQGRGILHLFRYHRCVTYPDYTL